MPLDIKYLEGVLPDREAANGKAWRMDTEAIRLKYCVNPGEDATIAQWVVECRWAHPFWHNYWIAIIHLRPTKQMPEPKINLPGATHEIWVFALNPLETPSLDNNWPILLSPGNFIGQFIASTDIDAEQTLENTVQDIIDGKLSPDTDFRHEWVRRFSDSNFKK